MPRMDIADARMDIVDARMDKMNNRHQTRRLQLELSFFGNF
jgi:hypothetical protein